MNATPQTTTTRNSKVRLTTLSAYAKCYIFTALHLTNTNNIIHAAPVVASAAMHINSIGRRSYWQLLCYLRMYREIDIFIYIIAAITRTTLNQCVTSTHCWHIPRFGISHIVAGCVCRTQSVSRVELSNGSHSHICTTIDENTLRESLDDDNSIYWHTKWSHGEVVKSIRFNKC